MIIMENNENYLPELTQYILLIHNINIDEVYQC